MKKIIEIFIVMLLIGTSINVIGDINSSINSDVKDEMYYNIDENCDCNIYSSDYIFYPYERPQTYDDNYNLPEIIIRENLPEYFSWLDYEGYDWTTPAKDQMFPLPCGTCWIHAALGALENVIKIREDCANLNIDLSEQYVLSCLDNFYCDTGAFGYWTFQYINDTGEKGNNCNGIIPEFCFPYQGVDKSGNSWYDSGYPPVLCENKCTTWQDFLIPITDYKFVRLRNLDEDEYMDIIKTFIMEKGPMNAGIAHTWDWHKWAWTNNEPDDYYPYKGPCETAINHEVVLLGWKDDLSIDNGGYWICKNSYGEEWGYDGFFNIEYGTNHLCSHKYGDVSWVDYDPTSYNNWMPTIILDESYHGTIGEIITFDAIDCFDHEGEIISYEWDFGDETIGNGLTISHIYLQQGIYPVTLTITDEENNIVSDLTMAYIDKTNQPPSNPIINGETNGKKGTWYNYTFSSTDPDGDDIYYYIYWGGFNWEGWYGPYESGEEMIIDHMWGQNETYVIQAKAKDVYGAESDWGTLTVSMPKNKLYLIRPILNFLQQHPNLFPLLRQLLLKI